MDLVNIRDLFRSKDEYLDTTVTIGGWVRSLRNSKNFGFIVVNDGTFFEPVQVVFSNVLENFEEVEKLNVGAAIIVTGKLVATPEMKQPFEIQAEKIEVEGASTPDYPLQKKKHSFEYLRTISHLRPRTNTFEAVFRVRSLIAYAIHKFFQERDFVYVHTPLITGSDCEGAGEMFQVTTMDLANVPKNPDGTVDYTKDFFNKPTNLTVSGQLNGETYAMAFKNIYTFGPTFRAENSNTTRHAAEFWMIEPEIAFADLEDDMILAESMLKYIIRYVLENAPEEMAFFNNFIDKGLLDRLNNVVNSDFARVTYTEAIEILEKHHNRKIDAPSGTAIALADAINESLDNSYHYKYDRSSERVARDPKEIGIQAMRGGTIVGEHDIMFAGRDEVITFTHTAYSREIFAKGAVEAAKFLAGKPAGLYDMADVVG